MRRAGNNVRRHGAKKLDRVSEISAAPKVSGVTAVTVGVPAGFMLELTEERELHVGRDGKGFAIRLGSEDRHAYSEDVSSTRSRELKDKVVLPIQVNEGGEYLILATTEIRGPNTKLVLSGGAHPYGETKVVSGEFRRLCCGVHVFLNPGQHTFKIQFSALPRPSRPLRESPLRRIVRMRRSGPSMSEIRKTHVFAIWLDDMLKTYPDQTARLISWIPDQPN